MKQMSLQEVQAEELLLLNAFRDYCESLNVQWSVAYGTLLGAVRHQGFIPWDDDVDVLVPRNGYEKILTNPLDNESIGTIVPGGGEGPWLFVKIYSKRTFWNETYTKHSGKLGVFIDVFPWDAVGSNKARSTYRHLQCFCKPYYYAYSFDYSDNRYKTLGGVARRAIGTVAKTVPAGSYRNYINSQISRSHGQGGLLNYFSPYAFDREYVDEMLCHDVFPVQFEGQEFPCLGEPEMHLRRLYGEDWQTPTKHVEHLHGEAFWRNADD